MTVPLNSVNSINYAGIPCSQCGESLDGHEVEIHEGGEDHPFHKRCLAAIAEQQLALEDVSIPCPRCMTSLQVDHLLPKQQIFFKFLHYALSGVGRGATEGTLQMLQHAAFDTIRRLFLSFLARTEIGMWPAQLGFLLYGLSHPDLIGRLAGLMIALNVFSFVGTSELSKDGETIGSLLVGMFVIEWMMKFFHKVAERVGAEIPDLNVLLNFAAFFVIGSFRSEIAPLLFNSRAFRSRAVHRVFAISLTLALFVSLQHLPRNENNYLAVYFLCAFFGALAAVTLEASELEKKIDVPSPFDLALD